jgi:transposase
LSRLNRFHQEVVMGVFIGLDVSLSKTAVCVVDRDGAVLWQGKVPSEPGPLIARLAEWSGKIDLAGIEACPLSEWLHRGLCEAGIPVVCIETRHAQRFLSSRPVKTDRNDARGLAEMMRLGHYRPVHVKSAAAQSMRTTLVARMQLVSGQLQIENTIRGLLRLYGLKIGAVHRNRFAARVAELLEMAAMPELSAAIEPLLRVRESMRIERKAQDRTLAAQSRRDEVTRRFMTVPGVGPVTSLAFKATIDDFGRFDISKAVGAHLGLTPRVYQSGEVDRSGQISKCGDRMMRHLLYEAASALMTRTRKWSRLRAWGIAVAKRRGMKRATVAVARKLAVILHRMWVTGTEFEFGCPPAATNAA